MILRQALETLEAPQHEGEKKQVLTAIKDLGLKVRVGDVAQKTALPVLRVTQLLNSIAYETQGNLAVDTAGGITYSFAPTFESQYLLNPSKDAVRWCARMVWNALQIALKFFILGAFFLIRLSFGLLLVASVVLIVLLVVAVIVAFLMRVLGGLSDSDSGGDGGIDIGDAGGLLNFEWLGGVRYFAFDWLWDWWYWGPYFRNDRYLGRDPYFYRDDPTWWAYEAGTIGGGTTTQPKQIDPPKEKQRANEHHDFLDNCFCVLFGSSDPNVGWEAKRWSTVAQAIKAKSGVVIADDLAPYMDKTSAKNEDWMLPVLVRFNGAPEVLDSGKLVYTFPALMPATMIAISEQAPAQTSSIKHTDAEDLHNLYNNFLTRQTVQKNSVEYAAALPQVVQKQELPIIGLEGDDLMAVWAFATVAVGGPICLLIYAAPHYHFIELLRTLLLCISAYGALFFLFPAIRMPFVAHENAKISDANEARVAAAQRLAHPDNDLQKVESECAGFRTAMLSGTAVSEAYTTEEDSLSQEFRDHNIR